MTEAADERDERPSGFFGRASVRIACCVLLVALAPVAPGRADTIPATVKSNDRDGDSRLSRDETPVELLARFAEIDRDGDGYIDEFEAWEYESARWRLGPADRAGAARSAGRPEIRTLEDLITHLDRDGDGRVAFEELPEALRERRSRLDINEDGSMDLSEARAIDERRRDVERAAGEPRASGLQSTPEGVQIRTFEREIQLMDTDGDGKLQRREASSRVQSVFERLDRNGDGSIDREEALRADRELRRQLGQ